MRGASLPGNVRLRGLLLALLASGLVGCFGHSDDTSGLAQPTDKPVVPPTPVSTPDKPLPPPDFSDPGYITNATWHVGDAWDYVSDGGHYHTIRVVDAAQVGNDTFFVTHETEGVVGNDARDAYSRWINASSWEATNLTDARFGARTVFAPGQPIRVLRNASFSFNMSFPGETDRFYSNVRYAARPKVTLPWGEVVVAGRFEYRTVEVLPDGSQQRILTVRLFSDDYGNDVSYTPTDGGETYTLEAVSYAGRSHGNLLPG